jgi:hypothetical protein
LIKAFACLVVIFWSVLLSVVAQALLLWFFLCACEEMLPLSDDDADESCQWEVQTDEGWTLN